MKKRLFSPLLAAALAAAVALTAAALPAFADGGEETPITIGQSQEQQAECTCTALCTGDSVNADCPVCGAEEADLTACEGLEALPATLSNALPATALAAGEHDSHSNGWTELTADTTTLSGGSYYLSGDVEYSGTEITVSGEVILCLNGHKLDLNKQHISVGSGASLTLYDCSTGGVLTGGSGSKGGGVYVGGGGTFTMTGGSIAGNTAESGGGVYVDEGGTFTMEDGSINNNQVTSGGGGGVMVNKGSFTLSGGSITGNATSDATYGYGGGVCLYGTFNLSGDAIIQNNTKAGATDNLYLGWNTINITGPLGENARIGVTAEGVPRSFISGWSDNMAGEDPADYFSSDDDTWDIDLNADGDVVLGSLCTIITQPTDKSVIEGETATFTVNATGSEPLSYQWQQNMNGSGWTDITGETNDTYTTGKTTMDMNGTQYRCVVSNSAGSVISDAATLTVNAAANVPVTSVTLDKTSLTLDVGGSDTLTATVKPDDASNKAVTWSTSNEKVATVDQNGNVKAVGAGKATITAAASDGSGKTATCEVTVNGPVVPPQPSDPAPSQPDGSGSTGSSSSSAPRQQGPVVHNVSNSSAYRKGEYEFWMKVRTKIVSADPGEVIEVNARDNDKMPNSVMQALAAKEDVTLRIRWNGGEEIVIPSAAALQEKMRMFYPLSYLAKFDFAQIPAKKVK